MIISLCSTAFYGHFIARTVTEMIYKGASEKGAAAFYANVTFGLMVIWLVFLDYRWSDRFYDVATVAFTILGFVLPPLYYLFQFKFWSRSWGVMAVLLLVLGVALTVVTIVWVVNGFMSPE
jgi:heme/copper-type cytochrome/quinol oxidase subunit 4